MSVLNKKVRALFGLWKKSDEDDAIILLQKRFIWLLFGLCILSFAGWMTSPSRLTVYVPPDISNGATLKAGEIPKPLVYSFAYQVWQQLNYWPNEGTQDYKNNIHTYWSYLTPAFENSLLQNEADLKDAGQVQRQRFLQGILGAAYDSANVKKLSDNTWQVDLKMRLTEMKNGQIVKDVEMLYPLIITRWDVSAQNNPYGLALSGYASDPVRLKTYV